MPTFVHTADVHLDTPFSARFTPRQMELRRRESMKTFQSIVAAAKERDFLFISGDLFDGRFVSAETVAFVQRCFREIPETQIFIAAGNHDPLCTGSVYQKTGWGSNVHIFDTTMEYLDFPEQKTRVHGRSFGREREEISLLESLPLAPDWCNILVLHGEVVANGGASVYNPIEKNRLAQCGADYVALGHIHQCSGLQRLENVRYAYCGIPEGRGFDEEGEKGFYLGEAEKGNAQLHWVPACQRRFFHITVDVTGMEDGVQIQEAIADAIGKNDNIDNLYKVLLTGKIRRGIIRIEILQEQLKENAFYLEICDKTQPDHNPEEVAAENTLRGNFAAEMLRKIAVMPEEEKEIGYLALELGLSAMERGQGV